MSVKTSTNRFAYDAYQVLEPQASNAVTASGASTNYITLDVLSAYWNSGDVAQNLDFAVVIETTALVGTGTYVVTAQVAPDTAFTTPVSIASLTITAAGRAVIIIDRDDIVNALAGAATGNLRLYVTLGGTGPSITYWAYASTLSGVM